MRLGNEPQSRVINPMGIKHMTVSELTANFSLPTPAKLAEERLERIAERFFDRLDAKFLRSPMTQAQYDAIVAAFSRWEDACRAAR